MGALITSLIREGALVLFHDYRSGTLRDWSGHGNHGTGSNIRFLTARGGVAFRDPDGYILVPDAPELRMSAQLTLAAFGEFNRIERPNLSQSQFLSKRDAGGSNFYMVANDDPTVKFNDAAGTHDLVGGVDYRGSRLVATSAADGRLPSLFLGGRLAGPMTVNCSIVADDAPLYIGNWYQLTRALRNPLWGAMVINRVLSADEHAGLAAEVLG